MEKVEMQNHYLQFSDWLVSLRGIDNESWNSPIGEGKWSVGAVITHLLLWDEYSLKERFPYFEQDVKLTPFPNYQQVNDEAKRMAEEITKEEIIDKLLEIRKKYEHLLSEKNEEMLNISFSIGSHTLTVRDYFKDFIDHDLHHQNQVNEALKHVIK